MIVVLFPTDVQWLLNLLLVMAGIALHSIGGRFGWVRAIASYWIIIGFTLAQLYMAYIFINGRGVQFVYVVAFVAITVGFVGIPGCYFVIRAFFGQKYAERMFG